MIKIVLSFLFAFSAPLLLLPVEKLLPYPYLIEELVKLVIVGIIVRAEKTQKSNLIWGIVLAGVLFTVSESVFYLVNIFANGNLILFPQRLFLTGMLHLGTILLLYIFVKKGLVWAMVGVGSAVLTHYFYNLFVAAF